MDERQNHIVCIASEHKGNEFLEECSERGWLVSLVTREKLLDAAWAWTSLAAVKPVPDEATPEDYIRAIANIAGELAVDRIVGLDEFDVITAAKARSHLQMEGADNYYLLRFRDKLRMRSLAVSVGINCPEFIGAFNASDISAFLDRVPAPWIVKPRTEVSAFGIRKCATADDVWRHLHELDSRHTWRDHPSQFLIERFITGKVFHVDSVVENGRVVAAGVSGYGKPPMSVTHDGGVFTTSVLPYKSKERRELERLNRKLLRGFGYRRGIAHAEFLQAEDTGEFYLLEVAARVGGAYIANVLEHAAGFSLWREWAKLETATKENPYKAPKIRKDFAGLTLALSKHEEPDTSHYTDEEIVYRVKKPRHVGLIFYSDSHDRVQELLTLYSERIANDFLTTAPVKERYDD
jgi:biotin carboxylase